METNNLRLMFFTGKKPLVSTEELKKANEKSKIVEPLIMLGYDDLDMRDDAAYINVLLNSNTVELYGKEYKIIDRRFKVERPKALWIDVEHID